jgi:hypothetical protein
MPGRLAMALAAGALAGVVTSCSLLGSGASLGSLASEGVSASASLAPGSSAGGSGSGVGRICGDSAIQGAVIPEIEGEGGCGVQRPVRVQSVAGVELSPQPTITCDTAAALKDWVENAAEPAAVRLGSELAGIEIAAHYQCRPAVGADAAAAGEHARGEAVDISALRLADGRTISVALDWTSPEYGPALRTVHAAACGPFGTTIGPGSNGLYETRLHYGVAESGTAAVCR